MTGDQARLIFSEIFKAAEEIAAKHGCAMKPLPYHRETFSLKLELVDIEAGGAPADFGFNASLVSLPRDCFGKTFVYGGRTYTITDIHPRRSKYPVDGQGEDGKTYKFPLDVVRSTLKTK